MFLKIYNKKWLIASLLSFYSVITYGQQASTFDITAPTTIYKPSSIATEMVHVTDIPVSTYSGSAQMNFMLFNIKSGDLTHNISLNYTTGNGILVEQDGNWVGLGWNLNVGGAVSRAAIGKNDETTTTPGYTSAAGSTNLPLWTDTNPSNWLNTISNCDKKDMGEGRMDMSPDMYFINFDGQSAKMFFDKNGAVFFSPFKAWKVLGNQTTGFTIIIENGTRYEFKTIESSSTSLETYPADATSINAGKSAWYLTRIVSATLRDSINFNYSPVTYAYEDGIPSYTIYDLFDGQNNAPCSGGGLMDTHRESYTLSYQSMNTYVLSSIVYNAWHYENANDIVPKFPASFSILLTAFLFDPAPAASQITVNYQGYTISLREAFILLSGVFYFYGYQQPSLNYTVFPNALDESYQSNTLEDWFDQAGAQHALSNYASYLGVTLGSQLAKKSSII